MCTGPRHRIQCKYNGTPRLCPYKGSSLNDFLLRVWEGADMPDLPCVVALSMAYARLVFAICNSIRDLIRHSESTYLFQLINSQDPLKSNKMLFFMNISS